MSSNTAVYAGAGLLASEAVGVTNLTPIGRDGEQGDGGGGGGMFPDIDLPDMDLPNIDMGAGPQMDLGGLGEGLGQLAQSMSEATENAGENFEVPGLPTGPQIPGPDDLRNAADSAGESIGSSVGTALGTAMYELIKTPSLALAEDLEPVLPYAEGDGGDTLQAMWDDSATKALAGGMDGTLPYSGGDWEDSKQAFNDDVQAAKDTLDSLKSDDLGPGLKDLDMSGGVTGDSDTNAAGATADRIQNQIDRGLTNDDDTNLATETKEQVQKDVGTAVEESFKLDNPMTGTSIDDTLNSAGLETNYSWDGPTVDDATSTVKDGTDWVTDKMAKVPL